MTGPCQRPECGGEIHTDGWGTPTRCPREHPTAAEPTPLTREELAPLIAAVHRRDAAAFAGANLTLPPLPPCPACWQTPTELATRDDQPITDRLLIAFLPCGHTFAADGEDVYDAYTQARQQAEAPFPDDGTHPEAPAAATPLEEAQATIESLRYQIRRAREALGTDEPDSAEAAIARVRALHRPESGLCTHCTGEDGVPYPCPTIRALDEGAP